MLFETQIAVAENTSSSGQTWVWQPRHVLMERERLNCLTEVRIEQFADDIAKFSFEMHYEADKTYARTNNPVAGDTVAILTGENGRNKVLVSGPVLEVVKENKAEGRSTIRYSGVDARKALSAIGLKCSYKNSTIRDIMEYVIGQAMSEYDIETPQLNTPREDAPITQTGNHLEFIKSTAEDHGFHFWLTYSLSSNPANPNEIEITPKAHFKRSPFFAQEGNSGGLGAALSASLSPSPSPQMIKVFVAPQDCPNVLNFNLTRNSERMRPLETNMINPATLDAIVTYDETKRRTEYNLEPNSLNLTLTVPDAPDQEEIAEARAALLEEEESFAVSALINTKKRLLGALLEPHQIVNVKGVEAPTDGQLNSPEITKWRVKDVVHVIKAFDHFMDVTIETNQLAAAEGARENTGLGGVAI